MVSRTKVGVGLKKPEYLSLVSKVCTELESHLGFGDRVLAEFITEMGTNCEKVDEFDGKLKENGVEMPDYFVRTLLTIIHAILPPEAKSKSDKDGSEGPKSKFSALNIGDSRERRKELEREIEMEAKERRKREGDEEEEFKKHRDRGRERDRDRDGDRYEEDGDRRDEDEPELYKVYKGRVSRVMDAGCFVQLNDIKGKEGLVHVSQMATMRIANAKGVVKRDQEVFVKVILISGQKLSLSMRDVDQNTGRDLLPLMNSR